MFCQSCGAPKGKGRSFCPGCGAPTNESDVYCQSCGIAFVYNNNAGETEVGNKSKIVAGLLALFFGGLGIHNFYLGYIKKAVIQLILGIICCGTVSSVWALVEAIMLFTGYISKDGSGKLISD